MTQRTEFILVFVRADDHDVWTDVKVVPVAVVGFICHPGAHVHIGDTNLVDVRFATSQAVLNPLHERGIKTAGFVVWIAGNTGKAGPFIRSLPYNAILPSGRRGPIKNRRIIGNKSRTRAQRVGDLLLIRGRLTKGRVCLSNRIAVRDQDKQAQREKQLGRESTTGSETCFLHLIPFIPGAVEDSCYATELNFYRAFNSAPTLSNALS